MCGQCRGWRLGDAGRGAAGGSDGGGGRRSRDRRVLQAAAINPRRDAGGKTAPRSASLTQRTVVPAVVSHGGVRVCHVTSVGGCVRIPGALRHSSHRPQQQEEEGRRVGGHR